MLNGTKQNNESPMTPEEIQNLEHQVARQTRINANLLQERQRLEGQLLFLRLVEAEVAAEPPPKTTYEVMKERRDRRRLNKG
jgi:hypothetical protein